MPTFPTPLPVAHALVAACEPIFAMIEDDPRYSAEGERLIVALLDGVHALDLTAILLIRRLRGRLEDCKRKAALLTPDPRPKSPRHG